MEKEEAVGTCVQLFLPRERAFLCVAANWTPLLLVRASVCAAVVVVIVGSDTLGTVES